MSGRSSDASRLSQCYNAYTQLISTGAVAALFSEGYIDGARSTELTWTAQELYNNARQTNQSDDIDRFCREVERLRAESERLLQSARAQSQAAGSSTVSASASAAGGAAGGGKPPGAYYNPLAGPFSTGTGGGKPPGAFSPPGAGSGVGGGPDIPPSSPPPTPPPLSTVVEASESSDIWPWVIGAGLVGLLVFAFAGPKPSGVRGFGSSRRRSRW